MKLLSLYSDAEHRHHRSMLDTLLSKVWPHIVRSEATVWGKIIQHVDEFSNFHISKPHTTTKCGPHINNSM